MNRSGPAQSPPYPLLKLDVDSDESVCQGIDHILVAEGRIDIVINNAGYSLAGAVEETSVEEARNLFETNFFGAHRVLRAVLPVMRRQGSGLIINISSIGGVIGLPYQGFYSASKFALEGLSEALRLELAKFNIKVVLVELGDFLTNCTENRDLASESQLSSSAYLEPFKNALRVIEDSEKNGCSPDDVGRLIGRLVDEPAPRLRYNAGFFSQRIFLGLKRVFPFGLLEWILLRHYTSSRR
jgi:NAD(P)-dependent dehydrogenase (short-subunit alcohol dehydrogenase family)